MALIPHGTSFRGVAAGGVITELLRVQLDGGDYIGFVEVTPTTTLADLRAIIARTLDRDLVPPHYQFVQHNGIIVGSKHEATWMAKAFLPRIRIVAMSESPLPSRVKVELWTGAVFRMWALPSCTFSQLHAEAARFWQLSPSDTVLEDGAGVPWPHDAGVIHTLAVRMGKSESAVQLHELEEEEGEEGAEAGRPGAALPPHPIPRMILHLVDKRLERTLDPAMFASQARVEMQGPPGPGGAAALKGRSQSGPGGTWGLGNGSGRGRRSGSGRQVGVDASMPASRSRLPVGIDQAHGSGDEQEGGGHWDEEGGPNGDDLGGQYGRNGGAGGGDDEDDGDDEAAVVVDDGEAELRDVLASIDPYFSPPLPHRRPGRGAGVGGDDRPRRSQTHSYPLQHVVPMRVGVSDLDFATESEGEEEGSGPDSGGKEAGHRRRLRHGRPLRGLTVPVEGEGADGMSTHAAIVVLPAPGQVKSPLSAKLQQQLLSTISGGATTSTTPPPAVMITPAAVGRAASTVIPPDSLFQGTQLHAFGAVEPRLWRVFTWYAAAGDASDPFHLRPRQWRCLLDDCGLLVTSTPATGPAGTSTLGVSRAGSVVGGGGGSVSAGASVRSLGSTPILTHHDTGITPQVADLIYALATGGGKGPIASGAIHTRTAATMTMAEVATAHANATRRRQRMANAPAVGMDYLQFLRALIAVAVRRHARAATSVEGATTLLHPASALPTAPPAPPLSQPAANPLLSNVTLPPLPEDVELNTSTHAGTMDALKALLCVTMPVYLTDGMVDKLVHAAMHRSSASGSGTAGLHGHVGGEEDGAGGLDVGGHHLATSATRIMWLGDGLTAVPPSVVNPAMTGLMGEHARHHGRSGSDEVDAMGGTAVTGTPSSFVHVTTAREEAITAFVDMVNNDLLPCAQAWPVEVWQAEGDLLRREGQRSGQVLVDGGSMPPSSATEGSVAAALRPHLPALRLLFRYYSFHVLGDASPPTSPHPSAAGSSPPRLPSARQGSGRHHSRFAASVTGLHGTSPRHGTVGMGGFVPSPAGHPDAGGWNADVHVAALPPPAAGGEEGMDVAGGVNTTALTDRSVGMEDVAGHGSTMAQLGRVGPGGRGSGTTTSAAGMACDRDTRRASYATASVARASVGRVNRPYSHTQMARLTLLRHTKSGTAAPTGVAGRRAGLDASGTSWDDRTARAVLCLPSSPARLWRQREGAAAATLSHPAWCRCVADMGLARLGDAVVPARVLTESFVASAGSAGSMVLWSERDDPGRHEEGDGTSRMRLTFTQFTECLARLALRAGLQHATLAPILGRWAGGAAAAAVAVMPRVPPSLCIRAQLQSLSNHLDRVRLESITAARAEHCTVYAETLLHGAAAFQKSFRAASAAEGHPDCISYFNAYLRQLPDDLHTVAHTLAAMEEGSGGEGTPAPDHDSVAYRARVQAMVEGGHHVSTMAEIGGAMPLTATPRPMAGDATSAALIAMHTATATPAPTVTTTAPPPGRNTVYRYRRQQRAGAGWRASADGRLIQGGGALQPPTFASDRERRRGGHGSAAMDALGEGANGAGGGAGTVAALPTPLVDTVRAVTAATGHVLGLAAHGQGSDSNPARRVAPPVAPGAGAGAVPTPTSSHMLKVLEELWLDQRRLRQVQSDLLAAQQASMARKGTMVGGGGPAPLHAVVAHPAGLGKVVPSALPPRPLATMAPTPPPPAAAAGVGEAAASAATMHHHRLVWSELVKAKELAAAASRTAAAQQRALRLGLPLPDAPDSNGTSDAAGGPTTTTTPAALGGAMRAPPNAATAGASPARADGVVATPAPAPGAGEAGSASGGEACGVSMTPRSGEGHGNGMDGSVPPHAPVHAAPFMSPMGNARMTISSSRMGLGTGGGGGGGGAAPLPSANSMASGGGVVPAHLRTASAFFTSDLPPSGYGGHTRVQSMSFAPSISRLVETAGFPLPGSGANGGGTAGATAGVNGGLARAPITPRAMRGDDDASIMSASVLERSRGVRASMHVLSSVTEAMTNAATGSGMDDSDAELTITSPGTPGPVGVAGLHTARAGALPLATPAHPRGALRTGGKSYSSMHPLGHGGPSMFSPSRDRAGGGGGLALSSVPSKLGQPSAHPSTSRKPASPSTALNLNASPSVDMPGGDGGGGHGGGGRPVGRQVGDGHAGVSTPPATSSFNPTPQPASTPPGGRDSMTKLSWLERRTLSETNVFHSSRSPMPLGEGPVSKAGGPRASVDTGGIAGAARVSGEAAATPGHGASSRADSLPTSAVGSPGPSPPVTRPTSKSTSSAGGGGAASVGSGATTSPALAGERALHAGAFAPGSPLSLSPAPPPTATRGSVDGATSREAAAAAASLAISRRTGGPSSGIGVGVQPPSTSPGHGAPPSTTTATAGSDESWTTRPERRHSTASAGTTTSQSAAGSGTLGVGSGGIVPPLSLPPYNAGASDAKPGGGGGDGAATAGVGGATLRNSSKSFAGVARVQQSPERLHLTSRPSLPGGMGAGSSMAPTQRSSFTARTAFSPSLGPVVENGTSAAVDSEGGSAVATPARLEAGPLLQGGRDEDDSSASTRDGGGPEGVTGAAPMGGGSGDGSAGANARRLSAGDAKEARRGGHAVRSGADAGAGTATGTTAPVGTVGGGATAEAQTSSTLGRRAGSRMAANAAALAGGSGTGTGGGVPSTAVGAPLPAPAPTTPVPAAAAPAPGAAGTTNAELAAHRDAGTSAGGGSGDGDATAITARSNLSSSSLRLTGPTPTVPVVSPTIAVGGAATLRTAAREANAATYRLKWKRLLMGGAVFRKYGRHGFPHDRRVFLTPDAKRLVWGSPSAKPSGGHDGEGLVVGDILDIVGGVNATAVLRKNAGWYRHADLCFSVVTAERTLDLEAPNKEVMEEWVTALLCLQRYRTAI